MGELLLNVGPGKNDSIPSTETLFGPGEAPGVDVQSNFLIAGCSARFDTTDFPGDPHVGTFAEVIYDRYHAQSDDRFSFHRLSGVAEQYVPFLNKKRVVVLEPRRISAYILQIKLFRSTSSPLLEAILSCVASDDFVSMMKMPSP